MTSLCFCFRRLLNSNSAYLLYARCGPKRFICSNLGSAQPCDVVDSVTPILQMGKVRLKRQVIAGGHIAFVQLLSVGV